MDDGACDYDKNNSGDDDDDIDDDDLYLFILG